MYTVFYGLARMPFTLDADSLFFWHGDKQAEALDNVRNAILEEDGHVVLTGDVGTGKTILVNALVKTLDDTVRVAKIYNPSLSPIDFFQFIANTYGAREEITQKSQFHTFFADFLQKSSAEGKSVLLVIDEAHKLSEEMLGEILLLPNIEKQGRRLFKLFFVGHSEFDETLKHPRRHALYRKISFSCQLEPFSEKETRKYVAHRLKVAGAREPIFSSDAIRLVHRFSRGYPSLVNVLCDRALLEGYTRKQKQIDGAIVTECVKEMRFFDPLPFPDERSPGTGAFAYPSPAPQAVVEQIQKASVRDDEVRLDDAPPVDSPGRAPLSAAVKRRRRGRFISMFSWGIFVSAIIAAGVGWNIVQTAEKQPALQERSEPQLRHVKTPAEEKTIPPEEEQHSTVERNPERNSVKVAETVVQSDLEKPADPPEMEKREAAAASNSSSPAAPPVKSHAVPDSPSQSSLKGEETVSEPHLETPPGPMDLNTREETAVSSPSPLAAPSVKSNEVPGSPSLNVKVEAHRSRQREPVSEAPKEPMAPQGPTALELAAMTVENGNFQVAIDLLETNVSPTERQLPQYRRIYARALAGKAYQMEKRFPDQALSLLRRSSEVDPTNFKTHISLGEMYAELEDYPAAIAAYRQAAALKPENARTLFNLGYLNATIGHYAEAEEAFAKVVQLKPAYLDKALLNLALMQEKQGKKEESLVNLQKAASLRPDSSKLQRYLRQLSPAGEAER